MIKVALYVRVSTAEQAEEGYSIGAQTDRLRSEERRVGKDCRYRWAADH